MSVQGRIDLEHLSELFRLMTAAHIPPHSTPAMAGIAAAIFAALSDACDAVEGRSHACCAVRVAVSRLMINIL